MHAGTTSCEPPAAASLRCGVALCAFYTACPDVWLWTVCAVPAAVLYLNLCVVVRLRSLTTFWKRVDGSCPSCGQDMSEEGMVSWFAQRLVVERPVPSQEDIAAAAEEGSEALAVRCCAP